MYNMFYFTSSLANTDRPIIERTPYQYSALASIAGLATTSVTATTFTISWTAYTNATLYSIFVNGVLCGTSATNSITVTPGYNGPWTVNVYAYNSSNALLASGPLTVPAQITNLAASSITTTGCTLSWSGGVGTGVSYTITYSPVAASAPSTASSSPVTVTNLAPSTTYTITLNMVVGGSVVQSASISNVRTKNLVILTTASGASPLIAYSFITDYYTSVNGTSGYYTNLANQGTDSFYVFNSLSSGTTTSTYTFKYLNFSTNCGTNYAASTAPKGSIGNNDTAYTNFISSITSSTTFTSFTITYWININNGNPIWNRYANIGDAHNYQIYDQKGGVENAGNFGTRTLNASTWYFVATTLTGETLYLWSCAVGSTFPTSAITVGKGSNSQGVNVNAYFLFGATRWNDGNAVFYLADLRIYGSALSQSDLSSMFTSGPNTN